MNPIARRVAPLALMIAVLLVPVVAADFATSGSAPCTPLPLCTVTVTHSTHPTTECYADGCYVLHTCDLDATGLPLTVATASCVSQNVPPRGSDWDSLSCTVGSDLGNLLACHTELTQKEFAYWNHCPEFDMSGEAHLTSFGAFADASALRIYVTLTKVSDNPPAGAWVEGPTKGPLCP